MAALNINFLNADVKWIKTRTNYIHTSITDVYPNGLEDRQLIIQEVVNITSKLALRFVIKITTANISNLQLKHNVESIIKRIMYYIVIRKQRDNDTPQISGVVRSAYASNISNMFYGSLLNETTLQIIVVLSAILFIFFHIPLAYCLVTIPVVPVLIYLFIYGAVTMKSAQVMYDKKPLQAWVAEVYEPPFSMRDPQSCWYKVISEEELESLYEKPEGRKRIVGTVAVMRHLRQPDAAWLYRLSVDERYKRKGIGLNLVKAAQEWGKNNKYNNIELAMSEYQEGARQLFDKTGFQIKQLYHKRLFTSAYTLQMYLLTSEVRPTFS